MTGADELREKLRKLSTKMPEAGNKAAYAEASDLMSDAIRECPVDSGRMRASAYVRDNGDGSSSVGFGAKYALPVHERTSAHHKIGKAKFLTDPLNARRSGFAERMAQRIQAFLKAEV